VKCAITKSKDLFENGYMTSAAVTFKKREKNKKPADNFWMVNIHFNNLIGLQNINFRLSQINQTVNQNFHLIEEKD
jgi:hypothetical protein